MILQILHNAQTKVQEMIQDCKKYNFPKIKFFQSWGFSTSQIFNYFIYNFKSGLPRMFGMAAMPIMWEVGTLTE